MTETGDRALAAVTGASRGIGLELARQCAQYGYDLVICAEDAGIEQAAVELPGTGALISRARTGG